jgi:Lon protease-like protein
MAPTEIALFPLNTVLFPGGILPLRIFEPRYLAMVSQCLRRPCHFAVVAIKEGSEVGGVARCYEVGTLASIVDFDRLDDGLLGITCRGEQRLHILSKRVQPDRLLVAEVEVVPGEPRISLPRRFASLLDVLKSVLDPEETPHYSLLLVTDWDSASWVGNRLAEILPLPVAIKQALLVLNDPIQRLDILYELLQEPHSH